MSGAHNLAELHSEDTETQFKDGDDGFDSITHISIEVAMNGYFVTVDYESGEQEKMIIDDHKALMEYLKDKK